MNDIWAVAGRMYADWSEQAELARSRWWWRRHRRWARPENSGKPHIRLKVR